jgi:hypothetical protein
MKRDWLHFVERSGDEGRAWATIYRGHQDELDLADAAMTLMHQGRLDDGSEFLARFAGAISSLSPVPESIRWDMDRCYHSAAGYYFYRVGDFEQAKQSMTMAYEAAVRAISQAEWLVLLALHCKEIYLHRARIARTQRHWREMNLCLEYIRAMVLDRAPLCQAQDGRKIWFSTLRDFFDSLGPLAHDELEVAGRVTNQQARLRLFDDFLRQLFRFKEIGIEYF